MKIKFGYREFELPESVSYFDLCNHIEVEFGIPKNRQNLKTSSGKKCTENTDFRNEDIIVKDLGPQFSYRGVFVLEYLGPILIVSLMKLFNQGYGHTIGFYAWMIHFLKREFETLFVHKFSRKTMPLFNLYKNCTYYCIFSLFIGYQITTCKVNNSKSIFWIFWILCQIVNFYTHFLLRFNKLKNGKRSLPRSIFFKYVCCPNYTAEILGWLTYSIITGSSMSYLFTLCGAIQMFIWARKKQANYKKTMKSFNKKSLIPFLI